MPICYSGNMGLILELRAPRGRRQPGELEESCPSRGHSPLPSQLCLMPGASFLRLWIPVATPQNTLVLQPFYFWESLQHCFPNLLAQLACSQVPSFGFPSDSCPLIFLNLTLGTFPGFLHPGSGSNSSNSSTPHSYRPPHPQPNPWSPGLGRTQDPHTQPRGNVMLGELSHVSVVSGSSLVTWEKLFQL